MYDFPDCKYTYFSLIDKSLGHLFHLPASIRTKTRLEYPLSKTPSQFARFPVTKFRHDSQPRRPHHDHPRQKKSRPRLSEKSLRDRNTPLPYTRPEADSRFSLRNVFFSDNLPQKQTPHKSTKPKSPPTTSPAEPSPPSSHPHYQCISPALEDTSSPASHFRKTSPLAPHSLLP